MSKKRTNAENKLKPEKSSAKKAEKEKVG